MKKACLIPLNSPLPFNISSIGGGELKFFFKSERKSLYFLSNFQLLELCIFNIPCDKNIKLFHSTRRKKTYPAHLLINLEFYSQMVIVLPFYETGHHCQQIQICSSANIVYSLNTFSLCQCISL